MMATEDGWIVVWSGAKDGPHRGLLSIPAVQPREPDRIDRRMAARVHECGRSGWSGRDAGAVPLQLLQVALHLHERQAFPGAYPCRSDRDRARGRATTWSCVEVRVFDELVVGEQIPPLQVHAAVDDKCPPSLVEHLASNQRGGVRVAQQATATHGALFLKCGSDAMSSGADIAGNALAGVIAAVTATVLFSILQGCRQQYLRRLDVKQIREVVTDGRRRVMEAKDTFIRSMNTRVTGDVLRAGQYNLMTRQLEVVLNHTTSQLPYAKRKEIFAALDWYNLESLPVIKGKQGEPVFVDLPAGKWVPKDMKESVARQKFERLESIKWLKLKRVIQPSIEGPRTAHSAR